MPHPQNSAALVATGLIVMVELRDFYPDEEEFPMTDARLLIEELAAKTGDGDFLRAIAESVMQLIMEADVDEQVIGRFGPPDYGIKGAIADIRPGSCMTRGRDDMEKMLPQFHWQRPKIEKRTLTGCGNRRATVRRLGRFPGVDRSGGDLTSFSVNFDLLGHFETDSGHDDHAASKSLGRRTRLQAAAVSVKVHATRGLPT